MEAEIGSQWDIIMDIIIDSGGYLNKRNFEFRGECSTIEFLYKIVELRVCLHRWLIKLNDDRNRTAELTNSHRNSGNKFFAQGTKYDVAADYYTKAIFSAPNNSIELALAHANRAACFVHMNEFLEDGYLDCVQAIKFNYPLKKRDKLLDRKFVLADQLEQMRETLCEMEGLIKNQTFTVEQLKIATRYKQIEKTEKDLRTNKSERIKRASPFENKHLIEKFETSVGRYVVAGEKIKKHQHIYREKAFAFIPVYNDYDKDTIFYHCQNCAKTNCIPFPCYDCVRASYCSVSCLNQHKRIHKYECIGYQKNLWMKIGIAHLAFRNFIVGFFELLEVLDELKTTTPDGIFKQLSEINMTKFAYADVMRLVTNFEKMDISDCLRYALTAQMLTVYLDEFTDFFKTLPHECIQIMPNVEDWKKLCSALLLKHMGQLVANGHAISDIELMPASLYDYSYRQMKNIAIEDLHLAATNSRIFTAIFPKISILNHSCNPNIRNIFNGSTLSILATREIAENEEIFNCYGPHYKLMSKLDRQAALKQQYCFECLCEKCITDDQTYEKMNEYFCPDEHCGAPISIHSYDSQWWHNLNEDKVMSWPMKFKCHKCDTPLLLSSHSLKEFFEITQIRTGSEGLPFSRTRTMTEKAITYYINVSKCLAKHHELKAIMAQSLLRYKMHFHSVEMFAKLAYIAMDYHLMVRERFGQYSLEMIIAITYAMNILQMMKELDKEQKSPETLQIIKKIRNIFDITKIKKSFTILSSEGMQEIFKSAIEKNFESGD